MTSSARAAMVPAAVRDQIDRAARRRDEMITAAAVDAALARLAQRRRETQHRASAAPPDQLEYFERSGVIVGVR
ncbi:hypothetical protein [Mycobacterium sp. E2238]|uniref:hypothetical protein n=1 Tax=Mycobacterium sp. E2238 TaxID=1834131 RepID=UPI0007FE60D0|nr:hypothetical protein [Mycobacterium sp. E2238]OBI31097.1 hypothetical protein A5711_21620 [Mycobacterium sp. E2238]